MSSVRLPAWKWAAWKRALSLPFQIRQRLLRNFGRSGRPAVALALVLSLSPVPFLVRPARAEVSEEDKAKAAELKKKGDALFDKLSYAEAVAAYKEGYALSKDPRFLYNMGRAHQALREWPEALAALEQFEKEAPDDLKAAVPKLKELIADVRSHITMLTVTCKVTGARVLVRDKQIGVTPLEKAVAVPSGPGAKIEVVAEGYFPYQKQIDLPGGTFTVVADLVTKATNGILTVKSSVAGSDVFVDGKPSGKVPSEVVLVPGTHKVLVRQDGYDESEVSAVVAAGERKDLTVDLAKKAPITAKWWFWTGVGVVVVGGAVLTYALLTEKKAGTGDFSPGQVSGPLIKF